jgi:hypothetical protein
MGTRWMKQGQDEQDHTWQDRQEEFPYIDQLSGSSKVASWAIGKFWEEKIGIQKGASSCSSCHA